MSHRWNCPTDSESRFRARVDADYDSRDGYRRYSTPYDRECPEAAKNYQREYEREFSYQQNLREEEAASRRAAERRRQEQYAMEEQWEQDARQAADDAEYERQMEEEQAVLRQEPFQDDLT
jgi:hypothetical protein